jgi:rhodanese-related sulfurtransferase
MSTRVLAATTLKTLSFDDALALVDEGAAFVDLRPIASYLDVHIPGSLALLYEAGPGMAARARDCIPLSQELILSEDGSAHMGNAAAALRGKGFPVLGRVEDAMGRWPATRGALASTEVVTGTRAPEGTMLDVGDPGTSGAAEALRIPVETLWHRTEEVPGEGPVVVLSAYGVRAGLAVGILERAEREVVVWRAPRSA